MKITTFLGALWIATIAGVPCALAGSAAGITKHDTEQLSDNALAHLAMDSLADHLGEGFGMNSPFGPIAPLGHFTFITRPRLTFVGGICQSDRINLELRSVDPKQALHDLLPPNLFSVVSDSNVSLAAVPPASRCKLALADARAMAEMPPDLGATLVAYKIEVHLRDHQSPFQ
jgi:hypothetical protein